MNEYIKNFADSIPESYSSVLFLPPGSFEPILCKVHLPEEHLLHVYAVEGNRVWCIAQEEREEYYWWYQYDSQFVSLADISRLANESQGESSNEHGKTKYDRVVKGAKEDGTIDVYAVLKTFNVTCPARQHALKKLLCTGIRGKGDAVQDLKESIVAIERAIELEQKCPTSSGTQTKH